MKVKFLAATSFAAMLFIASCTLFSGNNKTKHNLLTGRYEIINITDSPTTKQWMPGDTLKWFFNTIKDSSSLYINFVSDSSLIFKSGKEVDTIKYYSDSSRTVYAKTDSTYHPYKIIQQSDSTINFFATNDSMYVLLKKL